MLCKTGLPPRLASRAGSGAEALGKEEATPSWVSSPGETAALRAPGPPPCPPHLWFTSSAAPSLCGTGTPSPGPRGRAEAWEQGWIGIWGRTPGCPSPRQRYAHNPKACTTPKFPQLISQPPSNTDSCLTQPWYLFHPYLTLHCIPSPTI